MIIQSQTHDDANPDSWQRASEFLGEVLTSDPSLLFEVCVLTFTGEPGWTEPGEWRVSQGMRGPNAHLVARELERILQPMETQHL